MSMQKRNQISVVGSINADLVFNIDHIPLACETRTAKQFATERGGKGANQAVAASRLGSKVAFVGRVGADAFGRSAIDSLNQEGVDTAHVIIDNDCESGVAAIVVESSGENRILLSPGANGFLSSRDVLNAEKVISESRLLIVHLEIPLAAVECAISVASKHGTPVLLNPAPATEAALSLPFDKVTFLVPNEIELEILTGMPTKTAAEVDAAASILCKKGTANVIVTRGARGSIWANRSTSFSVGAPEVTPVDTTGAGDAFIGAFAHSYCSGQTIEFSLELASRYAAASVASRGSQTSYLSTSQFAQYSKQESVDSL